MTYALDISRDLTPQALLATAAPVGDSSGFNLGWKPAQVSSDGTSVRYEADRTEQLKAANTIKDHPKNRAALKLLSAQANKAEQQNASLFTQAESRLPENARNILSRQAARRSRSRYDILRNDKRPVIYGRKPPAPNMQRTLFAMQQALAIINGQTSAIERPVSDSMKMAALLMLPPKPRRKPAEQAQTHARGARYSRPSQSLAQARKRWEHLPVPCFG